MSQVKGIPYGISDFKRLRNENFYYVDKTMYLPLIEKIQLLVSYPSRRFGKSLFLSLMRTYYDILQKVTSKNISAIYGLAAIRLTSATAFRCFTSISQKAGCSQPGTDMMTSFNDYCGLSINQFAHEYASYYRCRL